MQKKLTQALGNEQASVDSQSRSADQVYSAPSAALMAAQQILADRAAAPTERAEALATLGRGAYYDNRIHEAVLYLEQALSIADDSELRAEIALILAPALSKEGRSADALAILEFPSGGLTPEQQGKAHNQRGIVLIELGRLPDAILAFRQARQMHQASSYAAGEGRALLNMAAAASEMGDQQQALAWYEQAWRLTTETEQDVMNAMIEGNLGYVASRVGDFSAALSWYARARASFSDLGEVGLLVAVLETDHAATLLDLGLNNDAFEAAEYARQSSSSGSNRMLEMQASLLLGEAQLRLRHHREAENTLALVRESAIELELKPWELRCDYLLSRLRVEADESTDSPSTAVVVDLAKGLGNAGWFREALRTVVVNARREVDRGSDSAAQDLLEWARAIEGERVDAIDVCEAEALRAIINDDAPAMDAALAKGFAELSRQRKLLGSGELQVRLGHRAMNLRELALRAPVLAGDAAAVLAAQQRSQLDRLQTGSSEAQDALRAQVRDARVGLQEARLQGKPTEELRKQLALIEHEMVDDEAADSSDQGFDPLSLCRPGSGAVMVSFLAHRGKMWAVVADEKLTLVDLGQTAAIKAAARAQRTGLRRMATTSAGLQLVSRAAAAHRRLDEKLIAPLHLDPSSAVVVVPGAGLNGVSWAALPSLSHRALVIASTAKAAVQDSGPVEVTTIGLLGGPGLANVEAEVNEIATIWNELQLTMAVEANVADVEHVFANCDLVHVAAHGVFRPDNPYFSSLEFHDQTLTVLDMERFEKLPAVVVLASCDSGAARSVGIDLVGTAEALLGMGVLVVIAPTVIVDDPASRRLVADLHAGLVAGEPIADALCAARNLALKRGTSTDVAVAYAFQAYGGSIALEAVSIDRI